MQNSILRKNLAIRLIYYTSIKNFMITSKNLTRVATFADVIQRHSTTIFSKKSFNNNFENQFSH
uniref:Uncharacterized protein n=1 Tax=Schistosoma mansoni TaxID=6183 RepID=A0A5K4FBK0_SCHMA